MQQTIFDRIRLVIERNGLTNNAFAVKANIDASNMRKILKGELPLTPRTAQKIADAYNVRYEWLLYGKGEMQAQRPKSPDGIPVLEGEQVVAGVLAGVGEPLEPSPEPLRLPRLQWRDGDFALTVKGRSMIDTQRPDQSIPDGAMVILHPWTENYIQWGETYCIATTDGYAIKRLMPGDDVDHIKCVSNNEAEGYYPYQVARSDIRGIAIVTAIIHLTTLHQ